MGERSPRRVVVTIRDVADAAGVSIATASKALNGRGKLAAATRERVQLTARRLGFRPNRLASSLHSRRSFTVGVLSNDIYGRFTLPILGGIEASLAENEVSVLLCNGADEGERERHLDALLSRRVDGIILTARRVDFAFAIDAEALPVPLVQVYARGDPRAPCLLPDDEQGGALAAGHLAELGRRRIAHVTGPDHFEAVGLRAAGYRAGLEAAGLAADPDWELRGAWSEAWGHEAVATLFAGSGVKPDAIFCGSDQIARGVADALRERGLGVPGDVALVGFDNWEIMAAATRPPLTTIDPNLRELGRAAGLALLGLVDGQDEPGGVRRLPVRLVARGSCGAHAGVGSHPPEHQQIPDGTGTTKTALVISGGNDHEAEDADHAARGLGRLRHRDGAARHRPQRDVHDVGAE